jgi:hypothetical protein
MRQNKMKRRTFGIAIAALSISVLAHVSALLLAPGFTLFDFNSNEVRYSARLIEPVQAVVVEPAPAPAPVVRPPRPRAKPAPAPVVIASAPAEPVALIRSAKPPRATQETPTAPPSPALAPPPASEPDKVALAAPTSVESPKPAGKPLETLPPQLAIEYELKSSLVDGRADFVWRRNGNRYEIEGNVEANGFLATMFVGRIEQSSQGEVTESGLKPAKFSLKRGETVAEFAEFQWAGNKIRHQRQRGEHVQDLTENPQDLLSFLFQFAYEFPEKLSAPGRVTFSITNARKLDKYEFRVVGNETLNLPIGPANTVHVIRQTSDPTETYEAWLDRDNYYLPVKLRFMLGGRVHVEQVAVSLKTKS